MDNHVLKNFAKYVSLNILGMIGLSCYILADTFFVSKALGATGIAALNFSIAIYSVIHGTGLMIGIGGASRFSILKSQHDDQQANIVFTTSAKLGILLGVIFLLLGVFGSKSVALSLGADESTLPMTQTYLTTILGFAPFFIMNNILLAFVRNDNNPNLSMKAMLTGSFSNIVLDYIFMFPLGMGMFGAAFATGLAPIISIGILSIHFIKGDNNIRLAHSRINRNVISDVTRLGLAAFISEVSSAVVLITYNLVILRLEGNLGVASYGIVANIALVGIAIFTGIAQGIQPLVSRGYGMGNRIILKKVIKYALITSLSITAIIYATVFFNADAIIEMFNSEQNAAIAQIAKVGLRLYFIGFFFAGINIIMSMYLSATERAVEAFAVSIARGCVILVPIVLLLSNLMRMTGIWFAFVLTEGVVTLITIVIVNTKKSTEIFERNKNSSDN